MTATVTDLRMATASAEVARFTGLNLVIEPRATVHAATVITDDYGLPRVSPSCGIGWAGESKTRFQPTSRPVDCERGGCHLSGVTVPTVRVSYAPPEPLFELGAGGDLADEFVELDTTEDEFDAMFAAGEPVELVQAPIPGLDHHR